MRTAIAELIDFSGGISLEEFAETAKTYLKDNSLAHYDKYDTGADKQIVILLYPGGNDFGALYDLTTDGRRNDLELIIEFFEGEEKPIINDLHVP